MATFYVSTAGNDGNPGTLALPWRTWAFALASAGTDDVVEIAPGLYEEAAVILGAPQVTVRGFGGVPLLYGGEAVAGTWVNHAGNVWKITTIAADPGIIILRSSALADASAFAKGIKVLNVGEVTSARKWFWDGGTTTLYLYSTTTPATAFYRVDYAPNSGTASLYSDSAGLYALAADGSRFERIAIYGYRLHGFGGDDTPDLTFVDCDISFNGADGCGGFNLPNFTYIGGRACWNGTFKARSIGALAPDGDGISLHTGGVGSGSDGFLILGTYFEGNTKSAVQNIHDSAGTIDRCMSINNQLHFPLSSYSTSPQTCRNCTMILAADDLGALGGDAGCIGEYLGCTVYGTKAAGVSACLIINGTISITNCIIQRFDVGLTVFAGSLTRLNNCWNDVTTLGFVLGGTEISADPLLKGIAENHLGIPRSSPAFAVGRTTAGLTHDRAGKLRPAIPSMGALEPPRGRPRPLPARR